MVIGLRKDRRTSVAGTPNPHVIFCVDFWKSSYSGTWRMEFQEQIQTALKALRKSLEEHETQRSGYERTIARLTELQKSVSPDSKVLPDFVFR